MSPISFGLDLILIGLLLAALVYGVRLNKRLKALRDTQAGFAQAALNLDAALARAEAGLSEMRRVTSTVESELAEQIDEARAATKRLELAIGRAAVAPKAEPASVHGAEPARQEPSAAHEERVLQFHEMIRRRAPVEAPQATRSRARIDDDLFDDAAPLSAGARR